MNGIFREQGPRAVPISYPHMSITRGHGRRQGLCSNTPSFCQCVLMLYCAQTSLLLLCWLLVTFGALIWCNKVCNSILGAFLHFLLLLLIDIFSFILCAIPWGVYESLSLLKTRSYYEFLIYQDSFLSTHLPSVSLIHWFIHWFIHFCSLRLG
jgi:hypothetical protein